MNRNGKLPLHEWLVQAIEGANFQGMHDFVPLLTGVILEEGHDAVIEAWNKRKEQLRIMADFGVTESLLEQKRKFEDNTERSSVGLTRGNNYESPTSENEAGYPVLL